MRMRAANRRVHGDRPAGGSGEGTDVSGPAANPQDQKPAEMGDSASVLATQNDVPDLSDASTPEQSEDEDTQTEEEEEPEEGKEFRLPWNMRNERKDSVFSYRKKTLVEELTTENINATNVCEVTGEGNDTEIRRTEENEHKSSKCDQSLLKLEENQAERKTAHLIPIMEELPSEISDDKSLEFVNESNQPCVIEELSNPLISSTFNSEEERRKSEASNTFKVNSELQGNVSEASGLKSLLTMSQPSEVGNRLHNIDISLEESSNNPPTLEDIDIVGETEKTTETDASPELICGINDQSIQELETELKPTDDAISPDETKNRCELTEESPIDSLMRRSKELSSEARVIKEKAEMVEETVSRNISESTPENVKEEVLDYQTIACRILKNLEELKSDFNSSDVTAYLEELTAKTGRFPGEGREEDSSSTDDDDADVTCQELNAKNNYSFIRFLRDCSSETETTTEIAEEKEESPTPSADGNVEPPTDQQNSGIPPKHVKAHLDAARVRIKNMRSDLAEVRNLFGKGFDMLKLSEDERKELQEKLVKDLKKWSQKKGGSEIRKSEPDKPRKGRHGKLSRCVWAAAADAVKEAAKNVAKPCDTSSAVATQNVSEEPVTDRNVVCSGKHEVQNESVKDETVPTLLQPELNSVARVEETESATAETDLSDSEVGEVKRYINRTIEMQVASMESDT